MREPSTPSPIIKREPTAQQIDMLATRAVDAVLGIIVTEDGIDRRLSPEQRERLFTEEILSKIPLDKYLELWRRGSPYFVSHITRQGFRDHSTSVHGGDIGKWFSGFEAITSDGKRIGSPLYVHGLRGISKTTVRAYLETSGVLQSDSKMEALTEYHRLMHDTQASAAAYPDRSALHMSSEYVSNKIYGTETGNEVFVVYPADFIASQFAFSFHGAQRDFSKACTDETWNDLFIWGEAAGTTVSIDAGIVFLPKDIAVDAETGSQYAQGIVEGDEPRLAIDPKRLAIFQEILNKHREVKDDDREAVRADIVVAFGENPDIVEKAFDSMFRFQRGAFESDASGQVWTSKDERGIAAVFHSVNRGEYAPDWFSLLYKRPEQTVPAQDYWERYFTRYPEKRPVHVVYYNGSPTEAVHKFMREQSIASTGEKSALLGFEKNLITNQREDERAWRGYEDVNRLAREIIEEQFAA